MQILMAFFKMHIAFYYVSAGLISAAAASALPCCAPEARRALYAGGPLTALSMFMLKNDKRNLYQTKTFNVTTTATTTV